MLGFLWSLRYGFGILFMVRIVGLFFLVLGCANESFRIFFVVRRQFDWGLGRIPLSSSCILNRIGRCDGSGRIDASQSQALKGRGTHRSDPRDRVKHLLVVSLNGCHDLVLKGCSGEFLHPIGKLSFDRCRIVSHSVVAGSPEVVK